jgi:hypothetical protein
MERLELCVPASALPVSMRRHQAVIARPIQFPPMAGVMGLAPGWTISTWPAACRRHCSFGRAGLAMANMILHGDAGMDLWPLMCGGSAGFMRSRAIWKRGRLKLMRPIISALAA